MIRKGTVAAMKGVFGNDVEVQDGLADSLKRLKRSCLKQIKPKSSEQEVQRK